MRDLTAQVTSSLVPFPGVTVEALGEDEITLDSVLQGKFTVGKITSPVTMSLIISLLPALSWASSSTDVSALIKK